MPDVIAPPRLPLHRRVRLRAGYHWRNGGHPLLTRLRVGWDSRDGAEFPSVRSEIGGVSVSYSGLPEGLAYTLDFTEQRRGAGMDEQAVRHPSTVRGRDLRSVAALPDADITIVGTSAARARALPRTASVVAPMRVHFVFDCDGEPETVLGRISKRARRNFRKTSRGQNWKLRVESDTAWFDEFYDHYYLATMRGRHGTRQRTESKDSAYECLYRTGRLFILTQDGEPIAGRLCHWNPATRVLTSRLIGVRDGADEHYANGAIRALHFLLIEWAARNSVRELDFQGTEPFLSKGTYQAKRSIGARVILPPNHFGGKRLWLRVRRDTPAVRDFLVANPLVTESAGGELEAVYFHDAERPARVEDYPAHSPGVARARQVDLDEFLASVPKSLLEEVAV